MIIRNDADLRDAYWILHCLKSYPKDHELVMDIKRHIRGYKNNPKPERRFVYDGGIDGFVELRPLPDAESEEQAEEMFHCLYYIEPTYSWFDCTGRPSTAWHKIIKRHGRYYVYHAVRYDV